jgi:DNA polymerase-3 subunit epsilon
MPSDRDQAAQWARTLLGRTDWCILDTETTGLRHDAEIVQIAIIDPSGHVLLDTLIKPVRPIPWDATHIHGITNEQVADAPSFLAIAPQLREIIGGLRVVIYNADYDERLLQQSALACGWKDYDLPIFSADYTDAMEPYSQWVGEWSIRNSNYRWQKLPSGDHTALGDARATLAIIKQMAGLEAHDG